MSKKNPEYDFKWCPGCGDFGVKRSIEMAIQKRTVDLELPVENNVMVAGIGCSGNLVHLLDGPQPFGLHGIHGRTLPISFGIKTANPDLNVLIVAGDGDFLSIGGEHIAPQAQRNLNVTAVIMDNGVYGLTKGQSSPTTAIGEVTPSTPFGKLESALNPLHLYLSMGVSFVASAFSSDVRGMASLIEEGMNYNGFSIVHVQSPCTTYADTYEYLKGNPRKGIEPHTYQIDGGHDTEDLAAAFELAQKPIPLGVVYRAPDPVPLSERFARATANVRPRTADQLIEGLAI